MTLHRGGTFGIGVYDLERRLLTPMALTGDNAYPSWTRDGDRITFVSNAAGTYNHFSIRFDGGGAAERLFTTDQGFSPERSAWSPEGRHLVYVKSGESTGLYLTEKGIMKVPVALGRSGEASLTLGKPSLVLEMTGLSNFDIAPDGKTLAIERVPIERAAATIHVVLNWFDELRRLVPAK